MASDSHLKLDGIEGESQDANHKGEIDIVKIKSLAKVEQKGTSALGGGAGGGKAQCGDIELVAKHGKHSPKLFVAAATGKHIASGTLTLSKPGGSQEDYSTYSFPDGCYISKFETKDSDDTESDPIPNDIFAINYAKIEHKYKEQGADGSLQGVVQGSYDTKQNKGE